MENDENDEKRATELKWAIKAYIYKGLYSKNKETPLKYHVFENIMENGAFALLEQMLHFP